ncbi:DUF2199 domain-containing protein [Sphingomonas sp. BT-65]|uniref:DUF2199 domain-containing protein n=1 Tax=Sphingomonas sp. BT-65 TaxID=2989821 RepID=UPI002236AD49|nr:DUF2199 domain-containing protein [Sphingomonas sp. BT-65]MCW4462193.1 DUF2199 domain-containing protein [Sphingomonas sp. BT-65]
MSWFRRAKPANPFSDVWTCAGCGEVHHGMMDLAAFAPDPWPHGEAREPNGAIRLEGDFLSEDFCVLGGKYFFVRAVLEIPVRGLAEKFGFGCWSTLSRENFDKYIEGFDDGAFPDWGPWTGWLCNRLETYIGTEPQSVHVFPQPDRQRPTLRIMDPDHALAIDQDEGITIDRLMEILRYYGHAPA